MAQQWRIEQPQSIDVEGVRRLEVRMVAGSVDVVGRTEDADAGAAQVEVTRVNGPLTVSLENGTLTIVHGRPPPSRCRSPRTARSSWGSCRPTPSCRASSPTVRP